MQNTKKSLENSPDTSTCDSTVQTINTVTFITCPAEYLSMSTSKVKIKKNVMCYSSTVSDIERNVS